jgi:hypothetical protein
VGFGASLFKPDDATNSIAGVQPHVAVSGAGLRCPTAPHASLNASSPLLVLATAYGPVQCAHVAASHGSRKTGSAYYIAEAIVQCDLFGLSRLRGRSRNDRRSRAAEHQPDDESQLERPRLGRERQRQHARARRLCSDVPRGLGPRRIDVRMAFYPVQSDALALYPLQCDALALYPMQSDSLALYPLQSRPSG